MIDYILIGMAPLALVISIMSLLLSVRLLLEHLDPPRVECAPEGGMYDAVREKPESYGWTTVHVHDGEGIHEHPPEMK